MYSCNVLVGILILNFRKFVVTGFSWFFAQAIEDSLPTKYVNRIEALTLWSYKSGD